MRRLLAMPKSWVREGLVKTVPQRLKSLVDCGLHMHPAKSCQGYVQKSIPYDTFADSSGSICVSEADYEGPVQDQQPQWHKSSHCLNVTSVNVKWRFEVAI